MTLHNPVPGLTRDLPQPHEAPDQVRGGASLPLAILNTTLTPPHNPLKLHTPNPVHAWTHP